MKSVSDKPVKSRFGKIVKVDHSGDTTVATFEPGVENDAVVVAQAELDAFLADCNRRFCQTPPVFAKPIGKTDYVPFKVGTDRIIDVETVIIQYPLVGG